MSSENKAAVRTLWL